MGSARRMLGSLRRNVEGASSAAAGTGDDRNASSSQHRSTSDEAAAAALAGESAEWERRSIKMRSSGSFLGSLAKRGRGADGQKTVGFKESVDGKTEDSKRYPSVANRFPCPQISA